MTLPDWNPDNYLLDFPDIHFTGYIVDAPINYKIMVVSKYIFKEVLSDVKKALDAGADLSALILTLACIDYLSGYFTGNPSSEKSYIAFLNCFFPDVYKNYNRSIYNQLRCGLLHNLVVKNPYKQNKYEFSLSSNVEKHLSKNLSGTIIFSIPIFIEDTRRAWIIYSHKLIMYSSQNQLLIENFQKRFDRNMGSSSVMVNTID